MITDREMDRYLLKYKDRFRVKKREDGTYEIMCRGKSPYPNTDGSYERNTISVYSFDKGILMFAFFNPKTHRATNNLRKKLKQQGIWFETHLEGDTEALLLFKEEDLERAAPILKVKIKRQFSPEYKQMLRERIIQNQVRRK